MRTSLEESDIYHTTLSILDGNCQIPNKRAATGGNVLLPALSEILKTVLALYVGATLPQCSQCFTTLHHIKPCNYNVTRVTLHEPYDETLTQW